MKMSSLIKYALSSLGLSLVSIINVSAITYQNSANVEFTFNPTITVSLSSPDLTIANLAPGSTSDSNVITATVSTNAGYGYYLSATTGSAGGNTNLTNTADSTYNFASLSSNAATLSAIPDNKWGYSYSTDNGTTWISGDNGSALSGYNGLPLDADDSGATGVKLLSSDSFATSGSVKFKIGARASSDQAAGTYTGTVNFYAVTNPAPDNTMQGFAAGTASTTCAAMSAGDTLKLRDSRDKAEYTIGKLADGNCWLLDNLALDLTNSTILNGMDESNTNASNTTLSYLKGTNTRNPSTDPNGQYATAGASNWTSGSSNSAPLTIMTYKDVIPSDTISQAGSYKVGGCYNYCATSAGSYCYGDGQSAGTPPTSDATEDICPKGWRIPTGSNSGEYSALAQAIYGSTGTTSDPTNYSNYRSALHLPLSGSSSSGSSVGNLGYVGYFWSSTYSANSSMMRLNLDPSYITPTGSGSRTNGHSVRCVLDF